MPGPSRDRVTVDLRGVGERLRSQAAARRMTTGAFVRRAVALQLDGTANDSPELAPAPVGPVVKLTLRVSAAHAVALATRARQAETSQGAYVAGLLDGMPPPPNTVVALANGRQTRQCHGDLALVVLQVLELAAQVVCVGLHVEMAMTAEIE